jgi:hypothetical protein
MTLEEYRIRHSMLIEQYQWIEFDLEGLFAFICGEPFCEALQEIEKDSIGGVVREIQKIEEERKIVVFSESEYEELDQIRQRRNFWCHVCYTEVYDKQSGAPKNAKLLRTDLVAAERFLGRLRQIKDIYAEEYRKNFFRS